MHLFLRSLHKKNIFLTIPNLKPEAARKHIAALGTLVLSKRCDWRSTCIWAWPRRGSAPWRTHGRPDTEFGKRAALLA